MSSGSNPFLKKIQEISDNAGQNNASDTTETINIVLKFPNKVYFSDLAYFVMAIMPPSGKGIGLFNTFRRTKETSIFLVWSSISIYSYIFSYLQTPVKNRTCDFYSHL